MSKHTPGPWVVQPRFLTIYNMSHGNTGLTCAVASVVRDQTGDDAAIANARLIAAAPELLEALKAMLENGADYTATRDQARAAIDKATGGNDE